MLKIFCMLQVNRPENGDKLLEINNFQKINNFPGALLLGLGTGQVEPSCKHDFACLASHFKHFGEFPRPKKYSVCIVFVTMLFPVFIVVFPAEIFCTTTAVYLISFITQMGYQLTLLSGHSPVLQPGCLTSQGLNQGLPKRTLKFLVSGFLLLSVAQDKIEVVYSLSFGK